MMDPLAFPYEGWKREKRCDRCYVAHEGSRYCDACREQMARAEAEYRAALAKAAEHPLTLDATTLLVWRFEHAPEVYRALSPHGGDEDWVLYLPPGNSDAPLWAEGGAFGCCDVSEHDLPNGARVWIGAHA